MPWRNTRETYGAVARALHWLMALLLAGLLALGWTMTGLTYYDRWYQPAFALHDSLGILALGLGVLRIAWGLLNPAPALVPSLQRWERVSARAVHWLLYGLLLGIPVSGYLISTARGRGVPVFGLFEVPALLPGADDREELAGRVHYYLAYGGAWLVLLHAAAAIKHAIVDRDGTLARMIGRRRA
jgi:cytochrome b561